MATEQKTLERIAFVEDQLVDSNGNRVQAEPISNLDLFFLNRVRDEDEQVIQNMAPSGSDYYMKSKHSFSTSVGYPGLCAERVTGAPEIQMFAVQYWRKK